MYLMHSEYKTEKKNQLYIVLGFFFLTNSIIAEFVGAKIFSLEKTLGLNPFQFPLLGGKLDGNMTAGVVIWPLVFILTDVINEYYGKKGVQRLSWIAVSCLIYSFVIVRLIMALQGADFWVNSGQNQGLNNMSVAFNALFGQGLMIILGSLVAFLVGQITDAYVFEKIKAKTGGNSIWLRATGSTIVSQFIDSYVVLIIAFYLGGNYDLIWVLQVGTFNYVYKILVAVVLLPVLYMIHNAIDRYLGLKVHQHHAR